MKTIILFISLIFSFSLLAQPMTMDELPKLLQSDLEEFPPNTFLSVTGNYLVKSYKPVVKGKKIEIIAKRKPQIDVHRYYKVFELVDIETNEVIGTTKVEITRYGHEMRLFDFTHTISVTHNYQNITAGSTSFINGSQILKDCPAQWGAKFMNKECESLSDSPGCNGIKDELTAHLIAKYNQFDQSFKVMEALGKDYVEDAKFLRKAAYHFVDYFFNSLLENSLVNEDGVTNYIALRTGGLATSFGYAIVVGSSFTDLTNEIIKPEEILALDELLR